MTVMRDLLHLALYRIANKLINGFLWGCGFCMALMLFELLKRWVGA